MPGRASVYIIVLVALALVAGACVERQPDETSEPGAATDVQAEQSEPTVAAESDHEVGYGSLDANPCSWEEISDPAPSEPFEDLAWISHQVVVGTVTEIAGPAWMEPDPRHPGRPGECLQIMTDYLVEIETHYRGERVDPLRVRARGGEIDGYEQRTDVAPALNPGDRVLLFLAEAPESAVLPDAWLAYSNRVWTISDDDKIHGNEWLDDFDVLALENVDDRIRDALGRQSHIKGTRNVTDAEAPIHVDRDEEREPIPGHPCSFYVDYDLEPHPPFDELAWSSEHIVVGTVIEDLGQAWAEPDNVDRFHRTQGCLEIMNDYIIEIEAQYHGEPADTLRIRAPGGQLDGYEQLHGLAPDLAPGDRYLFFLFRTPESEMLPDAWAFDLQRARQVLTGEVVASGHDETITLDEVEQIVARSLAGDPPPEDERLRSLWGSARSESFSEWEEPDDG